MRERERDGVRNKYRREGGQRRGDELRWSSVHWRQRRRSDVERRRTGERETTSKKGMKEKEREREEMWRKKEKKEGENIMSKYFHAGNEKGNCQQH